jgi:integrase
MIGAGSRPRRVLTYSVGVRLPSEEWGRVSLYSRCHAVRVARASSRLRNQWWLRHSSRRRPLNDSIKPFSTGPQRKKVPTVKEYAENYLAGIERRLKARSVDSTRHCLERYIVPVVGHVRLDEVGQGEVDAVIASLANVRVKTINNRLSALSSLLRYASKSKVISEAPGCSFFIEDHTPRDEEICAVPTEHAEAIVAVAEPRYRVAVLLAWHAGLRAGEIIGLRWDDIDELQRVLTVRRARDTNGAFTSPKHGKTRTVPLSGELEQGLRRMKRRGLWVVSRLDGQPLSYWGLRDAIRDLYVKADVETPRQPIHGLRHAYCTALVNSGVPIQVVKELAGHASIQTTLKYLHTDETQARCNRRRVWAKGGQNVRSWAKKTRKP